MRLSDVLVNSIGSAEELVREVRKLLRTNPINALNKKVDIFGFDPPFVQTLNEFDFEDVSLYDWYAYFVYHATIGDLDFEYFLRIKILFDNLIKKDNLDLLYYLGMVTLRNDEYHGIKMLEIAANHDCMAAQLKLLNYYCYNSYERNMPKALNYARALAKQGYTMALFSMGYLFDIGYAGMKPDHDLAIEVMEEAYEYGSEIAREWLLKNRDRD